MAATSRVIIRMWTKDGYHKDVAVLDTDQVRMHSEGAGEPSSFIAVTGGYLGPSIVVDPSKFPEALCFQVIASEYKR